MPNDDEQDERDDDGLGPDAEQAAAKPTRAERQEDAAVYAVLAERLAKNLPCELPNPPFDSTLLTAIREAQRFKKNARARQVRRVAQLLQQAGTAKEIRDAMAGRTAVARAQQAREQLNEGWRERLIEEGDSALSEFLRQYPAADPTALRQLVRRASKIPPDASAKKATTTLLRAIRSLSDAATDEA